MFEQQLSYISLQRQWHAQGRPCQMIEWLTAPAPDGVLECSHRYCWTTVCQERNHTLALASMFATNHESDLDHKPGNRGALLVVPDLSSTL